MLQTLYIYISLLVAFFLLVTTIFIYKGFARIRQRVLVFLSKHKLAHLPYFLELIYGYGYKQVGIRRFFSDGDTTILVGINGVPSGVIGIKLTASTLFVHQLQGIEKGNFAGVDNPGDYLISCAEGIAQALNLKNVRVMTARRNFYYNHTKDHDSISDFKRRQVRLLKMYDVPAESRGYQLCSKDRWWVKTLEGETA